MLSTAEKGIRVYVKLYLYVWEYVKLFIDMWKLLINAWKIMTKIKNLSIWTIGTYIIFTNGQCHKSSLYMVLSGLKIHLNLIKILLKTTKEIVMKDVFFEVDLQYPE